MNGAMSAIGTKQTLASAPQMSAIGGKADSGGRYPSCCSPDRCRHSDATNGYIIPAMQVMRLLAVSGVAMAAGAMISLWFAVSPSLTLLPPLPVPVDASGTVTSQQQQTNETVGAAITDTFEGRGQAADDEIPPIPVPKRDPLEGLIGGLLTLPLEQDEPQVRQAEPHDLAAPPQPERQESVTVVLQEPPTRPSDICAHQGQRRVYYTQNHHRYWRCADRR